MAFIKYLYLIILLKYVQAEKWDPDEPFLPNLDEEDRVVFGPYIDEQLVIKINENIEEHITIAFLAYKGKEEPKISKFTEPSSGSIGMLGPEFGRTNNDENWGLIITVMQDYEGKEDDFRYGFEITAAGLTRRVYLFIINLDDEVPIIEVKSPCQIKENTVGLSSCISTIRDPDGALENYMKYTLTGPDNVEKIFEIKNEIELTEKTKEWTTYLNTLQCLDFETTSLYLLDFTVTDSGNNVGTAKIVVDVIDMPDMPPVWKTIFSSLQFDEKTEQTFKVEATDGDIKVNDPINYKLKSERDFFSIAEDSGIISVKKIDRDALQEQIFTFEVTAFEVPDPRWFISQNVTVIVNDVNDNYPKITVNPKSVTIPENTVTKLEFEIEIKDMDLGYNGTYEVSLQDNESGNNYHTAFQIVPDRGYNSGKFTISVINSQLLDYEEKAWQTITFEIHSKEVVDESHFDVETVQIFLENLNDEYPMFEQESYFATVEEDIAIDKYIATVLATDRDIGDKVTHTLIGKNTNQLFSINAENGEITTLVENAFDYEKETEVIIQVQAQDDLCGIRHKNITQLLVSVVDVNDEPPIITVPTNPISIEENQKDGAPVNNETTEITATDVDTTAHLKFTIIWEESYARKNSQPVSKEDYEGCIEVITENISSAGHVRALLVINEIIEDNTPDYEKFDKLYIVLLVEDLDQKIEPKTDKVLITINIEDLNDNAPVFNPESITSIKRVTEGANSGMPIATIIATDADGPEHNEIVFSIEPATDDIPSNWVTIDPKTGALSVDADGEIDADGDESVGRPPFWHLTYIVTAASKELKITDKVVIDVIDVNDNIPIVTKIDADKTIYEASENNTDVQTILVTDADRDEAYNTPWFEFASSATKEVNSFFSIETFTGRVYVNYKENKVLDRDYGSPNFSIPVIIGDNYNFLGPRANQNKIDKTFMVILKDINNRDPIIQDKDVHIKEDLTKGKLVGTVHATDDDEEGTVNTKINFKIEKIEKGDGAVKDPPQDLFTITTDSEYETGIGTLTAQHNLEGYYGTYNVIIRTNDFGEIPGPREFEQTIFIHVEKYNFYPPTIIFPQNNENIYLEKGQQIKTPLTKYGGQKLELFHATDSQTEKWDILFTIDPESDPNGIFSLSPAGRSQSRLQLLKQPDSDTYTLKIIADCNCAGKEPLTNSVTINILFISDDSEPQFPVPSVTHEFPENKTGLDIQKQLPKASFSQGQEWAEFKIYYELKHDTSGCFEVGAETAILKLKNMLDREEQANHTLKVAASKNIAGNNDPDENSMLTVFITVLDVNDNPPNFEFSEYYGGIKPSDRLNTVVVKAIATDLDEDDSMTFTIVEGSLEAYGSGLESIKKPFVSETENGNMFKILLNFGVLSNMNGYFLFDIKVTDAVQHSHTASVKIYVVSDSSKTIFKFDNKIEEVEPKQDKIREILQKQFSEIYSSKTIQKTRNEDEDPIDSVICNIELIEKGKNEDGIPLDSVTDAITHFIDSTNNEPIDGSEIQQLSSKIEVFASLRSQFLTEGLVLQGFDDPKIVDENMEEMLRAWLIGVTVVLGTLCIILTIAFIVKTRSLIRRLNKLSTTKFGSHESGLNRIGIAAPNTNKHAIEGSNPVYSEEKRMPDLDTTSIGSGDSDLIGIEDNPNFEYAPEFPRESTNSMFKRKL